MKIYSVRIIYDDSRGIQHTYSNAPMTDSDIKSFSENFNEINWEGVNNIIYDKDTRRIIMAGGYTVDRGLFTDLY